MGFERLGVGSDPGGSSRHYLNQSEDATATTANPRDGGRKKKIIVLSLLAVTLIIASAVSATLLLLRNGSGTIGSPVHKPTRAISQACGKTLYPALCVNSLMEFPGSLTASEKDLVHISFNMTLQHFSKALYVASEISYVQMDTRVRAAYDDCIELLDDSIDALSRALFSVSPSPSPSSAAPASTQDVLTWLSGALTNQDTCTDGFSDVTGSVKDQISNRLKDLSELVSNCLAIFSASESDEFGGVPIQNRRRLLEFESDISGENADSLPRWLSRKERELLSLPVPAIQADIIVSKNGNGTYKTIAEAIKHAPENSNRRTIIYVMAGR